MKTKAPVRIFTPSFADESNTNAQNLTAKEIVARLDSKRFHVTMISKGEPDPRIAARRNTRLIPWTSHGNTVRCLARILAFPPHIYFFPRLGPLDQAFLSLRRILMPRVRLVTYVVATQDHEQEHDRSTSIARIHSRCILDGDCVVGNSFYVAKTIEKHYEVGAETIHSGVERRHFFPVARGDETKPRLSVLFAGSFESRKRPDFVIRQAARRPDVDFRLAGEGEEMESCRKLARELRCENVEFLGHLSSAALGTAMRKADVFLFPSVVEGHPQVLGQAAACGLPCVAMRRYHPDYVIHEQTGFLADTDEEAEQGLDRLLSDPVWRRKAGDMAALHAASFDWDRIAEQWEALFERLLIQ